MTTLVRELVGEWLYDEATLSPAPVLYVNARELRYDVPLDGVTVGRYILGEDASTAEAYAAAAESVAIITEVLEDEYSCEVWWDEEFRVVFAVAVTPEELDTLTLEVAGKRVQTETELGLLLADLEDGDSIIEVIRGAVEDAKNQEAS